MPERRNVYQTHIGLVIVAVLLVLPLTYWLLSEWLQGFAYRIDLTAAPLIVAIALDRALFLTVVGARAASAARACPVDTLRSE